MTDTTTDTAKPTYDPKAIFMEEWRTAAPNKRTAPDVDAEADWQRLLQVNMAGHTAWGSVVATLPEWTFRLLCRGAVWATIADRLIVQVEAAKKLAQSLREAVRQDLDQYAPGDDECRGIDYETGAVRELPCPTGEDRAKAIKDLLSSLEDRIGIGIDVVSVGEDGADAMRAAVAAAKARQS